MKLHCTNPQHDDLNESMEVYEDGGYCFACGWVDRTLQDKDAPKKEPENIAKTMGYIDGLPIGVHRGLEFPADGTGYYVVWPDYSYYKKRTFQGDVRYLGPRGQKPPFFVYPKNSNSLVLVEGEINCMSLKMLFPESTIDIASPGSASNMLSYLTDYLKYAIVTIVVDRDIPGVIAGLKTKDLLLKRGKKVRLIAVETDFNDVYQKEGAEKLRIWAKENLGL